MSGAQAKAAVIAGCIGVVAEVLCITVIQKLHYAFLNWSIFACSSDHLSSNPVVHLGIQFLNPSIYLYLSPPRYSVSFQELYVYLSERNQKPQRLESLRGRQIFCSFQELYVYLSERNQKPQRLESLRGRQIFCWSALVTNSHDFPWPLLFSCTFTSRFCLLFVSCVKVHFLLLSSIHLSTHSSGFRSTRRHN